jgi:hypothetical protein
MVLHAGLRTSPVATWFVMESVSTHSPPANTACHAAKVLRATFAFSRWLRDTNSNFAYEIGFSATTCRRVPMLRTTSSLRAH